MDEFMRDVSVLFRFPPFLSVVGWSSAGWAVHSAYHGFPWWALGYGFVGGVFIGLAIAANRKPASPPREGGER